MPAGTDSSDSDARLSELIEGMLECEGEPDVEAVISDNPEYADELRELWATAALARNLGRSIRDSADPDSTTAGPPGDSAVTASAPDDYELIAELGRGGMGVVYKARQRSLDRVVALKMILAGSLATELDIKRFRAEAEAAGQLEHPHIVPVYEVGESDGSPWFSMQFIRGQTLTQRLADGPLTDQEAAGIVLAIARAVSCAHTNGVLHRDLKTSNILIDETGHPYVSDFGLARRTTPLHSEASTDSRTESAVESLTRTGAIVGTPAWMSPEQINGQSTLVGPATDVYGLGAILYATLTGRPPFQAASPVDTLLMVLEQDPVEPRALNKQVHPDLQMITLKCLQKPADLRYSSADALAADLEAFLANEPVSARSSHFFDVMSRAFRESHHAAILHNWGLLWMWHSLVLLLLCFVTNGMQLTHVESRWPYAGLWTIGLSVWAVFFWNVRRRAGPITFVERQIAHVWAGSMAASTLLFGVEAVLELPVLSLSPVLGLISGTVFLTKAGILSGRFYLQAVMLFATGIAMAWLSLGEGPDFSISLFGIVSALCFFVPGLRAWRARRTSVLENGTP